MQRIHQLSTKLLKKEKKDTDSKAGGVIPPVATHNPKRSKKLYQIEEDTTALLNTWRTGAKIDPTQIRLQIWGDDFKDTLDIWEMCYVCVNLCFLYFYGFKSSLSLFQKQRIFSKVVCNLLTWVPAGALGGFPNHFPIQSSLKS